MIEPKRGGRSAGNRATVAASAVSPLLSDSGIARGPGITDRTTPKVVEDNKQRNPKKVVRHGHELNSHRKPAATPVQAACSFLHPQ